MRFGLSGAGCIGEIRAQGLARAEGCSLAAVFDVNEQNARKVAGGAARICRDYAELVALDDVDAVVVSTPPQFHEEQVLAALEAGKHVLCEKPLANNVDACHRMVDAAERVGKTLTTGFNHRYFPCIQYAKETLTSGKIGELDHVRAFAGHPGLSEFRSPWEYDKEVMGGGCLMDVGIHMTDLTRFLLGEVDEVYGVASDRVWNLDGSEDNAMVLMRSTEGKTAIYQSTWTEWKGYRFHIEAYGTRGMVRAYYAPMSNLRVVMDEPGGRRKKEYKFYPGLMLREKLKGWQSTVIETFRREFGDFKRLCEGGPGGSIADGFAGLRAVEIAQAIYRCSEERQPVRLAPREPVA